MDYSTEYEKFKNNRTGIPKNIFNSDDVDIFGMQNISGITPKLNLSYEIKFFVIRTNIPSSKEIGIYNGIFMEHTKR